MPLKALNPQDVRYIVMITCGPWHPDKKDWCKQDLTRYINNYFGTNIKQTHCVAEIGSGKDPLDPYEGYHHLHMPIQFHSACKPFGVSYRLREHMNKTWTKIPGQEKGFSVRIDSVPRQESKEGQSPYDYICLKYIESPIKDKAIDEDGALSNKRKDPGLENTIFSIGAQSYKGFKKLDPYYQRIFISQLYDGNFADENILWDWRKIPHPYKKNQSNSNLDKTPV